MDKATGACVKASEEEAGQAKSVGSMQCVAPACLCTRLAAKLPQLTLISPPLFCPQCPEGCAQCDSAAGPCTFCDVGRGLVDGQCLQCQTVANCGNCDDDVTVCSYCANPYYLSETTKKCEQASQLLVGECCTSSATAQQANRVWAVQPVRRAGSASAPGALRQAVHRGAPLGPSLGVQARCGSGCGAEPPPTTYPSSLPCSARPSVAAAATTQPAPAVRTATTGMRTPLIV